MIPLDRVHAFVDGPHSGNPAAVCLLEAPAKESFMQALAKEMNLSETAFLVPREGGFDLRWFTPEVEVDLCGHATLASAHTLWERERLPPTDTARFHTKSGWLTARRDGDLVVLDFPATPPAPEQAPEGLVEALGANAPQFVGKTRFDYFLRLPDEASVRALNPDFGRLRQLPVRGVVCTATASETDADFVSRFFAPAAGVDEDPVTGSAHCALAPYWVREIGRGPLMGVQLSERRGRVRVQVDGDRVQLAGRALTVIRGELLELG